ncbi:HYR domain-containing protein, partial [Halobacillus litoralis]
DPPSGSFFPVGTTQVTCIATDASGNESEPCMFEITVNDTEPPIISCPDDIIQDNDPGQCGAIVNYPDPVVMDNCPGATSACDPPSGSFFPVGTTQVTCIATDASGNESEPCMFEITVNDTEPPTISCPEDIVVLVPPGETGAVVNYPAPIVTDNCPGVISSCLPASGSFFPVGITEITCTAEDTSGNKAECTFNIRVEVAEVNTLRLDVLLSHDVQVVTDATLEIEGLLCQPRNNRETQRLLPPETSPECINAQMVYDWISFCKEVQSEVSIPPECSAAILECRNAGGNVTIQCDVVSESSRFFVLDGIRDVPGIPGASIVPIRFRVLLRIQYFCDAIPVCEFEAPICHVEDMVLCYPEGTFIKTKINQIQCVGHYCPFD